MQKIKNLIVSESEFSENKKWAEVESIRIRLLESSDWILLSDSNIINQNAWKDWRRKVRGTNRKSCNSPDEMHARLQELENEIPRKIYKKFNNNHIELTKEKLIKMVRFFYNKKIDIDLYTNFSHPNLIHEKYTEAINFKKRSETPVLLNYLSSLCNRPLIDLVEEAILEKEQYFTLLIRMQNEIEKQIATIKQENNIETLNKIYHKYNTWISTLTSTPEAV